jgi:hypothetical protein
MIFINENDRNPDMSWRDFQVCSQLKLQTSLPETGKVRCLIIIHFIWSVLVSFSFSNLSNQCCRVLPLPCVSKLSAPLNCDLSEAWSLFLSAFMSLLKKYKFMQLICSFQLYSSSFFFTLTDAIGDCFHRGSRQVPWEVTNFLWFHRMKTNFHGPKWRMNQI